MHYHPTAEQIYCVKDRPWLNKEHEHQIVVMVTATCADYDRRVDLLILQDKLEQIVAERVISFGSSSFEKMCEEFFKRMNITGITSIRIEVDGGVEGAEVYFV